MKIRCVVGLLFSILISCPAVVGQSPTTSNASGDFTLSGYDVILNSFADSGKGGTVDMRRCSQIVAQWAKQTPLQSLAFLEKEIESNDEKRTMAALFSVALLTAFINYEGDGQVDAAVKSDFSTKFPAEKIKKAIAGRPDRAMQFMLRSGSPQAKLFPELPGLQQQYWDEKKKAGSGVK